MATDIAGLGTILQISISATYTTIPQCYEISWDGFETAERNPTHLSSTAKPKKPGLPDLGSLKFKCWFDPNDTTHALLRDRVKTPATTLDSFKLKYADTLTTPAQVIVTGFVKTFSQTGFTAEDGTVEFEAEIPVSTATFTAGTP